MMGVFVHSKVAFSEERIRALGIGTWAVSEAAASRPAVSNYS